ncbi:MAG: UDP-N-acetylmuramoyl-L-alanyl-D-glutamate--2,6-diaminopimelate ligase [Patescibacteria group bacterium]
MKKLLKKILPKSILSTYHYCLAWLAALVYGFPARKLIIIGVTGTYGKTTTSYLTAQLLELAGFEVGLTSTALFKVGPKVWLNDKKMTMLGRAQTHRLLRQMVKAGCRYAIVETSSEGILQHRQIGIHYDILIFTNLSPEHLEAHGGFANYKATKLKLFKNFAKTPTKEIYGQPVPKVLIGNLDNEHSPDFLQFRINHKIGFGITPVQPNLAPETLIGTDIQADLAGLKFKINQRQFASPLLGEFNIYNNLGAIAAVYSQGVTLEKISELLPQTKPCPGRLDLINEGQPFTVIVDFAFEPKSLEKLYSVVKLFKKPDSKIINLLGSGGGGRDKARRPILGGLVAQNADQVVITNEDPYDEDPLEIINQIAAGARAKGKVENQNLWLILDRREAINQALSLAQKDDIVLISGKGCEQAIVTKNDQLIPWDDRQVAREELKKIANS